MIDLMLMNGQAFIWNADDWFTLRHTHHIVGSLIGTLGCLPRQDSMLGLPMALTAEETRLLLDKKIARLVNFDSLKPPPSADIRQKFEEFRSQSYLEQVEYFREERKKQITNMVDIIIEGKRRKLLGLNTKKSKGKKRKMGEDASTSGVPAVEILDRAAVIEQEIKKIMPLPEESALVQIPTAYPWLQASEREIVDFPPPSTPDELVRSCVFKDLWEKGYSITSGNKFGGDFLVYPGDPIKFHAQFIVLCRDSMQPMKALELVSLARLGTAVKKAIVLACVKNDAQQPQEIVYQTLRWTD